MQCFVCEDEITLSFFFCVADDLGLYANPNTANSSASLSTDVIAPPTYDDVVKFKQMMEEQRKWQRRFGWYSSSECW